MKGTAAVLTAALGFIVSTRLPPANQPARPSTQLARSTTADRVMQLTRDSPWKRIASIPVGFPTHHPQGMVRIGDTYYVSSVEVKVPTRRLEATRRRVRP